MQPGPMAILAVVRFGERDCFFRDSIPQITPWRGPQGSCGRSPIPDLPLSMEHSYYQIARSGFGAHPRVAAGQPILGRAVCPFARRHRVLRYDARGWGRSALPTAKAYRHHDDLLALMDHLGLERAHVLGLSMGGAIAIDFALTHPGRTAALISVSSGPGEFQARPDNDGEEKPKRPRSTSIRPSDQASGTRPSSAR